MLTTDEVWEEYKDEIKEKASKTELDLLKIFDEMVEEMYLGSIDDIIEDIYMDPKDIKWTEAIPKIRKILEENKEK